MQEKVVYWLVATGVVAFAVGAAMGYYVCSSQGDIVATNAPPQVLNFEECAAAGNAVMESYPRQCRSEEGQLFVEKVEVVPPSGSVPSEVVPSPEKPRVQDECVVAGCSGQICGEAGEVEGLVTTCEFRQEHVCVRFTRCERQADGMCGWTENSEYRSCLQRTSSP